MTSDVSQTLATRGADYGDFLSKAAFIQNLKEYARSAPAWTAMEGDMQESLDLIFTKVGRILFGRPDHQDSWHDIAGYAKLVDDRLLKRTDEARTATASYGYYNSGDIDAITAA